MRWILIFFVGFMTFMPVPSEAAIIRIGIDNNPPLNFINQNGKADGLFPDLFSRIAKAKDWSIEYAPCQWQQCLEQLSTGQINILPAIAYTEQRAKNFRFAEETVINSWGQIYHRADKKIESILQLAGKKLAVLKKDVYYIGEQGLLQVTEQFDLHVDYVEVASYREAFSRLAGGDVDAAMVGRIFGIKNRQEFNLLPAPIMIKPIQVRPAFSPDTPRKIVNEFDQSMSQWKSSTDSVYYQLLNKWIGEKPQGLFPNWLRLLMYSLSAILSLLLFITFWTRKQVRIKTLQLADKNSLLEKELIERRKIEQELLERQQQYNVFFEDSHSAMLLVEPESAEIIDVNPAACNYYQYSREQMRGMKVWQLNPLGEKESPERLDGLKRLQHQQFEFVHRLADGQERPVEIHRSPIQVGGRILLCSIVHDISKRKKAERDLEERNRFLQSVIDGVSDPLMVIGLDHSILQINQSAQKQMSAGMSEFEKLTCYQFAHASQIPCSGEDHRCPIMELKETGLPATLIHQREDHRGSRVIELSASPLFDSSGELYAIIEVARDITERMQIEELLNENEKRLHHLAHHDPLTDLPNRMLFEDRLNQAISKARRSRKQVALFFLDLDHLKAVNDNLGHEYGDLLLIDVANRLRNCVRESDTVARMGGDEFLILLEETESIEMIETMAERICSALNHTLTKDDFSQPVSASIGISIYPEDAATGQDLMKTADLAMYRVKKAGKAHYQFYSSPQGQFLFH